MKRERADRSGSGQTGSTTPAGQDFSEQPDEQLTADVARLASELSEAQTPSRRHRLARAIPRLARPRRQVDTPVSDEAADAADQQVPPVRRTTGRRIRTTRRASGERLQSASRASSRRIQATSRASGERIQSAGRTSGERLQGARKASGERIQSASRTSSKRIQAAGQASWKGVQAGGQASWRGLQATGRVSARGVTASGRWLASQVITMAPKIPIRSVETLRAQHPGKSTEQIADSLINGATRAAAGIGVTIGTAVAIPFIPTAPMELGVETLALAAVEIKMIAELHEVYGMRAKGSSAERMVAYLGSWAHKRGLSVAPGGVTVAISAPLRRQIERRLAAKAGRSVLSLAPLLAGAAAGGLLNQRETRKLGEKIRNDLRKQAPLVAVSRGQR
jgi:hypothetical protein